MAGAEAETGETTWNIGDKETAMKIKETIERECCQRDDRKPYRGAQNQHGKYFFCVHCGQIWEPKVHPDPAGGSEIAYERLVIGI